MSSEYAIEAVDVVKVYRSMWTGRTVRALDGVSVRVPRGAVYGFLGPNGAGKTTFVKILLSAAWATSGRAAIFGTDSTQPESRRAVGYLPENHRFPTYFTGAGMLDFYGALSGLDGPARKRRIPELFDRVGLDSKWANVRLGKYSKGMLQRVGLAQALLHEPQLLVLDEPTDGVDPVGRRQIRDLLQELAHKGVTVFINSHQLMEIQNFCDSVTILSRGKIALEGRVRDLVAGKGYRLVAPSAIPEALLEALRSKSASMVVRDGVIDLQFASRELVNEAIDLLRAGKCEVEAVIPTTSTLEDVFVRAVNG